MKRRAFITLLGGAVAAWPRAVRAQQPAMPVIGFLSAVSPGDAMRGRLAALRQALAEGGYVEGRNVAIEYRWAEGRFDRLPELAADLVRRQVSVMIVVSEPGALAAKAATTTIPIVFGIAEDPVALGLVANIARPGGNLTGVNFLTGELVAKRMEVLRELIPAATRFGVLVNPGDPRRAEAVARDAQVAARSMERQVHVLKASTSGEIDEAFATFARERTDALFVAPDPFFTSRRVQFAIMAARHAIPASYAVREFAEVGGLMTYGTRLEDMYRQVGTYTGRILRGAKPADLPVVQSSKFELVINRQAAKALGLEVPERLLARADEVIE
jgi:putative tryptophan/tyrosine transport system substrate-binding protein